MTRANHTARAGQAGEVGHAASERVALRSRVVASFSWSVAAKVISQGATFVGTLLLARILPVASFGLVAMAQVYLGFLQVFIDAGFLHALIQRPNLTQQELAGAFWLLLALGCAGFGCSFLAQGWLDAFFRAPGVGWIIVVMSSILLFLPFRTIGQAVLSREVRIEELSKREAAISVARVILSIALAWRGAGVWSLVVPQVLGEIVFSLSCYRRAGWRIQRGCSYSVMRPIVRYGVDITLSRIVWFGATRADQFIVGRVLGPTALGVYALAWQFAQAVPQFASATLARVSFPVFSQLQADAAQLKSAFLATTRYTAFAVMPAFAGLALVADDLFPAILNPAWRPAIVPLQILCPLAMFKMFEALAGFVINARGQTRRNIEINMLGFVAIVAGVSVGARIGGVNGVSALAGVASIPVGLLFVRAAMKECAGSLGEWAASFARPLAATAMMAAFAFVAKAVIPAQLHGLRLGTTVLAGMVAYAGAMLLVGREVIDEIRGRRPLRREVEADEATGRTA